MKVLFITHMYPSEAKPYAGVFIKNEYESLVEKLGKDSISIKHMKRTMTSPLGTILKYFFFAIRLVPVYFTKYDIIHIHYFFLLLFMFPYKWFYPNSKFVVSFLGKDINFDIKEGSKFSGVYSFLASKIDCTVPVGRTVDRVVKQKLKTPKNVVNGVGVDENIFYHIPDTKKEIDFLYVGSYYHLKGIDIIVKAIKKLGEEGEKMRFCFIGSGPLESELRKLESYDNVEIKQSLNQVQLRSYFNKARFFMTHARSEGFPTVTLESMFCGTPIIISDIEQCTEQVTPGENGWVVPLGNEDLLAEKLTFLYAMKEEDYIKHKEFALNACRDQSLDSVTDKLLYIYHELSKSA